MASEDSLVNALAHTSGGRAAPFCEEASFRQVPVISQRQLRQGSETGKQTVEMYHGWVLRTSWLVGSGRVRFLQKHSPVDTP